MTTAQKLERTLRGKGYEGVSCTEWRKSIRLEGELDDWKAIVKAGKIAAKAGYKGVINDITLKASHRPLSARRNSGITRWKAAGRMCSSSAAV